MPIKVLIVDDHAVVRAGIRMLLESDPELAIVGEGENGEDAIRLSKDLSPDVVLMDVTMPEMDGVEATRRIKALPSPPAVLALSIHEGTDYFFRMLQAGASGYVPKRAAPDELLRAIHVVARAMSFWSPASPKTSFRIIWRVCRTGASTTAMTDLTEREREILTYIAEDATNMAIANALNISVNTVERHRENIMRKLNLHTRTELVKYAIRKGLISLDDV